MGAKEYIIRRAISSITLFFLAIILNFFIFRIMPGDPTMTIIDIRMTPEMIEELRRRFGLDKPLWEQFLLYLRGVFTGDFGRSFEWRHLTVWEVIFERRFQNTLILMGSSMCLAMVIGTLLGILAAYKRGSKFDAAATFVSLFVYSTPIFWSGLIVLLIFSYYLGWIPSGGTLSWEIEHTPITYVLDYLHHMIAPMIILSLWFLASYFMVMRSSILDVFTQDYIVTAEAKGLSDRRILFRHAARNALLPTVSLMAVHSSYLISGATLTETVFSWYGMGKLMYDAVMFCDYPVLHGIFFLMSVVVILANFIADIAYMYLDPRIRY